MIGPVILALALWSAPGADGAGNVSPPTTTATVAGAPAGDPTDPDVACAGDRALMPCEAALAVALEARNAELRGCHRKLATRTATAIAALVPPAPAPEPPEHQMGDIEAGLIGVGIGVLAGVAGAILIALAVR